MAESALTIHRELGRITALRAPEIAPSPCLPQKSPTSRQLSENVQVRAPAERMSQVPSKRLPHCAHLEPVHRRLRISAAAVVWSRLLRPFVAPPATRRRPSVAEARVGDDHQRHAGGPLLRALRSSGPARSPAWPADHLLEEAAEITATVALVQQTRGRGGLRGREPGGRDLPPRGRVLRTPLLPRPVRQP